ncbi:MULTISPECIES: hypothetical protein [unclassified Methylobacterium]|uniref:hypothetical protein n=1 Tax=unclassified Methylobacterium TaxID=2615210 RepID=UPI000701B454|nr:MULTISPECIES: hypothetical protein [unclassified Methylobacterium]KQP56261.1 hypothetical protein ASF39_19280 [Methylobacterium sp. Leaf108]KQT85674.1 hypothetical protein ASG59_17610 [Methylobacterium sp. Leaf466]
MDDATRQQKAFTTGRETLIRDYAAGDVSWKALREAGFEDYVTVLAHLGELGLRPPVAPMDGPNVESRGRGRAILREALRART